MKKFPIFRIVADAMFCAMVFALGLFSVDLQIIKFTFEGFPIMLGACLFGPVDGMLIGTVGTFLSQLLGPYGLDATTVLWILPYTLSGLFIGLTMKDKKNPIWAGILLGVVNGLLITTVNTIGLYIQRCILWGMPFETSILIPLPSRLIKSIIQYGIFGLIVLLIKEPLKKVYRAIGK